MPVWGAIVQCFLLYHMFFTHVQLCRMIAEPLLPGSSLAVSRHSNLLRCVCVPLQLEIGRRFNTQAACICLNRIWHQLLQFTLGVGQVVTFLGPRLSNIQAAQHIFMVQSGVLLSHAAAPTLCLLPPPGWSIFGVPSSVSAIFLRVFGTSMQHPTFVHQYSWNLFQGLWNQ